MRPSCLPAALLALAVLPAWAADPLKSPECGAAIAALQQARSPADVGGLRQAAALACLGGSGEAVRPSPVAQAPVVVPPPVIVPPAQPPRVQVTPPPPLPAPQPPATITSCDGGGCWDSNGTRLQRVGPQLVGPGGACATAGHTVRCP